MPNREPTFVVGYVHDLFEVFLSFCSDLSQVIVFWIEVLVESDVDWILVLSLRRGSGTEVEEIAAWDAGKPGWHLELAAVNQVRALVKH